MVKIFLLVCGVIGSVTLYVFVHRNVITFSSNESNTIQIPPMTINLKDNHRLQLKLNLFFKNKAFIQNIKAHVPIMSDSLINYFRRLTKDQLSQKTLDDIKDDLDLHIGPFVANKSFECFVIEEFLIS